MKKNLFALIGFYVCILCFSGYCDEANNDVAEYMEHSSINWSRHYILAIGVGYPSKKNPVATDIGSQETVKTATHRAKQTLLDTAQYIKIDAFTRVKDLAAGNNDIMAGITRMIGNAKITEKKYMSDGAVEVIMRLDIYGGFSQLVLPDSIQQVETIQQAVPVKKYLYQTYDIKTKKKYTGLIVDAKGITVKPAMVVRIMDEQGIEVYGSAFVSREYVVQDGMCQYIKSYDKALKNPKVADLPLTVKGLRTSGNAQTDIFISNADAARVRSAPEHIIFLRKCRVIIVVD